MEGEAIGHVGHLAELRRNGGGERVPLEIKGSNHLAQPTELCWYR